jgi:hypothetical protein
MRDRSEPPIGDVPTIRRIILETDFMRRSIVFGFALAATALASPLQVQGQVGLSVEPYVGYGFFGTLPGDNGRLEAEIAYGGRVGFGFAEQWGLYGSFQRSSPAAEGRIVAIAINQGNVTVDHVSAGVEFSYVPRGGAEGMLPVLLEAGVGQARYGGSHNDFGANLGIASALQLSRNFAVRYGVTDFISNYRGGDGIVNQITARVGAELSF